MEQNEEFDKRDVVIKRLIKKRAEQSHALKKLLIRLEESNQRTVEKAIKKK